MSFILDALKKSEAERNRKTGPVLMDMRIARPRRQLPVWVWVIAVVLLANLALLGYVLFHGTRRPESIAAADQPRVAAATAATAAAPAPAVDPATTPALPPPALPASSPPAAGGVIMQSNAVVTPDNYAASARTATTAGPPATQATMAADTGLPSDEELRQAGIPVPELRLSLHVYDNIPANRFVLLNSSRLHEGQETADGVLVERIDETGVVLSWRGRRFRMHPGN